jgi:hypothetical protein
MSLSKTCLLTIALAGIEGVAGAQQAETRLTASVGNATDVTGVASRAATVATLFSLTPSPHLTLGLGGNGTHFEGGPWSASAGGSLRGRMSSGRSALTLDAGADYTTTSYRAAYLTAAVAPVLEACVGPVTGFFGGRASYTSTSLESTILPGAGRFGAIPSGPSGTQRESVSRNAVTALYGGMLRLAASNSNSSVFRYAEERGTVANVAQVDRIGSAAASVGVLSMAVNGGVRSVAGERTNFGGASLTLALSETVSLNVAAARYPANRLTGAAAGRFAGLGISFRLAAGVSRPPKPAAVDPPPFGLTRLSITAPNADRVELAGDFTQWNPVPARRAPNGVWYVDLRIAPGEYRYAFRVNGKEWRVPAGVRTADDDFGGKSAWLTVMPTDTGHGR